MSEQTRAPLATVLFTVKGAAERKLNTNGKAFVVAKGQAASGRPVTAMTYGPMMQTLLDAEVGSTIRFYGKFEGGTFNPVGISVPREQAPAAAA